MIYLDTHVLAWAYAGEIDRFPASVSTRIEESDLLISPIVLLELQHLKESDRLTVEPGVLYENLASTIGLAVCDLPMMRIVTEAMLQSWTSDPFDRIITATAAARDAHLLTKDASIHAHYAKAFWDKGQP